MIFYVGIGDLDSKRVEIYKVDANGKYEATVKAVMMHTPPEYRLQIMEQIEDCQADLTYLAQDLLSKCNIIAGPPLTEEEIMTKN